MSVIKIKIIHGYDLQIRSKVTGNVEFVNLFQCIIICCMNFLNAPIEFSFWAVYHDMMYCLVVVSVVARRAVLKIPLIHHETARAMPNLV